MAFTSHEQCVFVTRSPSVSYESTSPLHAPELGDVENASCAQVAVRDLLLHANLDRNRVGRPDWNPLGEHISPGANVLIKPNWVLHTNRSGLGNDCLVTHTSLLLALLPYVVAAKPRKIVVGDAPMQGCDFTKLIEDHGITALSRALNEVEPETELIDFRRTILNEEKGSQLADTDQRSLDHYVLFDLGKRSFLEEITDPSTEFRVTMYDPDALGRRHSPGRHQYLVAREVLEADVVINVPKLKTHKKAGLTGALKNLVGINGNKEFLPHHRKGGDKRGGDCYEGGSRIKYLAEELLDIGNRSASLPLRRSLGGAVRALSALATVSGQDSNYDGSWHGNDTVWRMCLDLHRIVNYGNIDGSLSSRKCRKVLTFTDGIIAGEGDGPLAPEPVPLGIVTYSESPSASDWVHALVLGMDPRRLALIQHSFTQTTFPLADCSSEQIRIFVDGEPVKASEVLSLVGRRVKLPYGWQDHCEAGLG